jgi:hypothetical protein
VEFTLEEVEEGTRLLVRESTPEFSTALELRAQALVCANRSHGQSPYDLLCGAAKSAP